MYRRHPQLPFSHITSGGDLLITHLKLLFSKMTSHIMIKNYYRIHSLIASWPLLGTTLLIYQCLFCRRSIVGYLPGETPLPSVLVLFMPLLWQLLVYISFKIKLCAVNYQPIYVLIVKPSLRRLSSKAKKLLLLWNTAIHRRMITQYFYGTLKIHYQI